MPEEADGAVLKMAGETHGGSIPLAPTITFGPEYLLQVGRWAYLESTRHSEAAVHMRQLLRELHEQRRLVYRLKQEPPRHG